MRSAAGLGGRLADVWDDVGPRSGWLGGDGESWERGPYYARGLVALAAALDDDGLRARARPWIEWTLGSQGPDGFFGPRGNDDWWARMPMLDAVLWHHECVGDARVAPFVERYLRHLHGALPARPLDAWGRARGAENMRHALWLHARTGDAAWLDLVDLLRSQTTDWCAELAADEPSDAFELAHGVNRAMGLRLPLVLARRTGDARFLEVLRRGWERTLARHGQVQGSFSCDEMLHGTAPTQGTELCTVVELLETLLHAFAAGAGAWAGDALERLAYNALPAMIGPDGCTRQYFTLANQVACTPGPHRFWYHHDTDLLFGVATGYGCCTANMHVGWPTVARSLWLATPDGGLVAPLFGPCELETTLGAGARLRLVEETAYPFDDRVRICIGLDRPVELPLGLRIPGWCRTATVAVNGEAVWTGEGGDVVRVVRGFGDGDVVDVRLESPVRATRWDGGTALERGPLVYAVAVGEEWRRVGGTPPFADFELHPTTRWSVGLAAGAAADPSGVVVEGGAPGGAPWTAGGAPVRLRARGRFVAGWELEHGSAATPPASPSPDGRERELVLVPFGAARLRTTVLPVVG